MPRKCVRDTRKMRWCQGRYRLRRAELRMSAGRGPPGLAHSTPQRAQCRRETSKSMGSTRAGMGLARAQHGQCRLWVQLEQAGAA